jgi:hypothetical protein
MEKSDTPTLGPSAHPASRARGMSCWPLHGASQKAPLPASHTAAFSKSGGRWRTRRTAPPPHTHTCPLTAVTLVTGGRGTPQPDTNGVQRLMPAIPGAEVPAATPASRSSPRAGPGLPCSAPARGASRALGAPSRVPSRCPGHCGLPRAWEGRPPPTRHAHSPAPGRARPLRSLGPPLLYAASRAARVPRPRPGRPHPAAPRAPVSSRPRASVRAAAGMLRAVGGRGGARAGAGRSLRRRELS